MKFLFVAASTAAALLCASLSWASNPIETSDSLAAATSDVGERVEALIVLSQTTTLSMDTALHIANAATVLAEQANSPFLAKAYLARGNIYRAHLSSIPALHPTSAPLSCMRKWRTTTALAR